MKIIHMMDRICMQEYIHMNMMHISKLDMSDQTQSQEPISQSVYQLIIQNP